MKNRKQKRMSKMIYYGHGFPVILKDVPLVEADGEELPQIDYRRLAQTLAVAVALHPSSMTGAEVRFIRQHLELTQDELADVLDVTRNTVINWEKSADEATRMNSSTELVLRLYVLDRQGLPGSVFKRAYSELQAREGNGRRKGFQFSADPIPSPSAYAKGTLQAA